LAGSAYKIIHIGHRPDRTHRLGIDDDIIILIELNAPALAIAPATSPRFAAIQRASSKVYSPLVHFFVSQRATVTFI
jgi:hypothetical protein